jgi:hypothetical protein
VNPQRASRRSPDTCTSLGRERRPSSGSASPRALEQPLRRLALSPLTRIPEGVRDLVARRIVSQHWLQAIDEPEAGCLPEVGLCSGARAGGSPRATARTRRRRTAGCRHRSPTREPRRPRPPPRGHRAPRRCRCSPPSAMASLRAIRRRARWRLRPRRPRELGVVDEQPRESVDVRHGSPRMPRWRAVRRRGSTPSTPASHEVVCVDGSCRQVKIDACRTLACRRSMSSWRSSRRALRTSRPPRVCGSRSTSAASSRTSATS